jgi:hypothetical protein
MADNFDDVLFSQEEPATDERQSENNYDPDAYKEQKQQERDEVYAKIDNAALALTKPDKLKEYLDIQSRFDLYRPGNVLLIQAQMPTASRLKTYEDWQAMGAGVKRNQHHLVILKSGKQYTRDDGTIGQFTDIKKVFDISQTFSARGLKAPNYAEGKALIKALMSGSPVPAAKSDALPDGMGAYYDNEAKTIYVRPNMEAQDIFRCMSMELAQAELVRQQGDEYSHDNAAFAAYCSSYILCRENGVDVSNFNFDNAPRQFEGKEAKEIRADLSDIREAAGEIGSRMKEALREVRAISKEPKEQENER